MSENEASIVSSSACQFLIYSTFVLVPNYVTTIVNRERLGGFSSFLRCWAGTENASPFLSAENLTQIKLCTAWWLLDPFQLRMRRSTIGIHTSPPSNVAPFSPCQW